MPQLTPEHRDRIIRLLAEGQELPSDDRYLLFPPERREYELVYAGRERRLQAELGASEDSASRLKVGTRKR